MHDDTHTTTRVWILGASDPEMEAIERLLTDAGESTMYATADGRRVHPGHAYGGWSMPEAWGRAVYLVECDPIRDGHLRRGPGLDPDNRERDADDQRPSLVRIIDHHRPGDPGYGRPPAEFLPASSIGQVIAELARAGRIPPSWRRLTAQVSGSHWADPGRIDQRRAHVRHLDADGIPSWSWRRDYYVELHADSGWRGSPESPDGRRPATSWRADCPTATWACVPTDLVLTAAADHCLAAAYRGECPGVDPDELMRWRAESRAAFQDRPVKEVLADIAAAQEQLHSAEQLALFDQVEARDMRRDEPVPELPEAAMRMGVAYVAGPITGPDGRRKITCSGRPEHVRAFLDSWAPAQGLVDTYGDPARGFAGGYLPD